VSSAEIAYDTHPKENVTGVIYPPETAARARPITSPPIIKRMENKSDGLTHCARKLDAASSISMCGEDKSYGLRIRSVLK
jgi:hypothetical protein